MGKFRSREIIFQDGGEKTNQQEIIEVTQKLKEKFEGKIKRQIYNNKGSRVLVGPINFTKEENNIGEKFLCLEVELHVINEMESINRDNIKLTSNDSVFKFNKKQMIGILDDDQAIEDIGKTIKKKVYKKQQKVDNSNDDLFDNDDDFGLQLKPTEFEKPKEEKQQSSLKHSKINGKIEVGDRISDLRGNLYIAMGEVTENETYRCLHIDKDGNILDDGDQIEISKELVYLVKKNDNMDKIRNGLMDAIDINDSIFYHKDFNKSYATAYNAMTDINTDNIVKAMSNFVNRCKSIEQDESLVNHFLSNKPQLSNVVRNIMASTNMINKQYIVNEIVNKIRNKNYKFSKDDSTMIGLQIGTYVFGVTGDIIKDMEREVGI